MAKAFWQEECQLSQRLLCASRRRGRQETDSIQPSSWGLPKRCRWHVLIYCALTLPGNAAPHSKALCWASSLCLVTTSAKELTTSLFN